MSDFQQDELPIEGDVAEDSVLDDGVAEAGADEITDFVDDEPQYEFLEVDDALKSKYVRAKVDGEEVPVPFDELVSSYSRESVSTQRFQEAAALKQEAEDAIRLQQALQVNPGLTIQFLAQQAGVPVEEYLGMSPAQRTAATEQQQDYDDDDEFMDPLERKYNLQEQRLMQMEERLQQREADERLSHAVGRLKADFNINDDQARAVVGQAMQMGLGVDMLPMVYRAMAHEASQQATAQHTAKQEAEKQRRQARAAQAAQTVGTGTSAAGTTSEVSGNFTSIREAALAAVESLEL